MVRMIGRSMLEVTSLRKSYGGVLAVNGVSFRAGKGETIGLLGPNGAGKTTTVSVVAGLVQQDAGEVRIAGRTMRSDTDPAKRSIGLVPRTSAFMKKCQHARTCTFSARSMG